MKVHQFKAEPWKVTLVDTGRHDDRGRLKRVANYIDDHEPFCFTYGDGVADIDIPPNSWLSTRRTVAGRHHGNVAHPGPFWLGALDIPAMIVQTFHAETKGMVA